MVDFKRILVATTNITVRDTKITINVHRVTFKFSNYDHKLKLNSVA
jgi:hypothetical protein